MKELELKKGLPMPSGRSSPRPWRYWKEKAAAMEAGDCYEVETLVEATALRSAIVGLYGHRSSMRRRDKETGLFIVWRVK